MVGFLVVRLYEGEGITTVASGVEVFDRVLVMRFSEFSVKDSRFWPSGVRA